MINEQELLQKWKKAFSTEIRVNDYEGFVDDWNDVLLASAYIPVTSTRSSLEYQYEYIRPFVKQVVDLSVIFCTNGKAVGVLPLILKNDTECEFAMQPGVAIAPLFLELRFLIS